MNKPEFPIGEFPPELQLVFRQTAREQHVTIEQAVFGVLLALDDAIEERGGAVTELPGQGLVALPRLQMEELAADPADWPGVRKVRAAYRAHAQEQVKLQQK